MRGIYFGWYVVAATIVIYALLLGATFASFGLYILPVSEEFGLSRADMNTGLIVLNLGNAALAPVIGRLLDRVSARRLMMVCSALIGVSLVIVSQSDSLMLDVVLLGLFVSAGVLGGGTISVSVLLARWFTVYRGRAMALAALGMTLGGIVVAPLVGSLIDSTGWRTALLISGAGAGLIVFALAFLMRDRPGPDDVEVRDAPPKEVPQDSTSSDLPAEEEVPGAITFLKMRLFWLLAIGIGIGSAVSQGLTVSLVPIAHEAGLSTMQAASLISVTGITGLVSMLALAAWGDRVNRTVLLTSVIFSISISCLLLLVAKSYIALLLTAGFIGLSLTVIAPVYIALIADRFGLLAFGTVRGLFVPIMSLFGAISVRFIGEVFDRTGSYDEGLWVYLALVLVSAGLVFVTRPAKLAKQAL